MELLWLCILAHEKVSSYGNLRKGFSLPVHVFVTVAVIPELSPGKMTSAL